MKREGDTDFMMAGKINAPDAATPYIVRFQEPIIAPRIVRIEVTDAYSQDADRYYVSLAQFECYESRNLSGIGDDAGLFTDLSFSALRPGVTAADIAGMSNPFIQNIAAYLHAGKYDTTYRVKVCTPYKPLQELSAVLKTSGYSQFENPTGIFLEAGDEVVVFVDDTGNETISLRVRDFGQSGDDHSYPLFTGANVLQMKGQGLAYVSYYTGNYQSAQNIKVHIASGKVNGYFDATRHNNEDGKRLLDGAVAPILDLLGERVHLAYTVNALKNNAYTSLFDLVAVYDSIVASQHTMMGLPKYGLVPANRMFGRVSWSGYMFKDGLGAGFNESTMGTVANVGRLKNDIWGPAHEFGHVNQVQPGMMWVGTAEVTNNIFSKWIQYCYTPDMLRLETENVGGNIGGRYNAYFTSAFLHKQEWGLQAGPDRAYGAQNGRWDGDHFVKLAPLWQLHVFFHLAGEGNPWHRPYFWADIFEKVRNTNEDLMTHGALQINFCKNLCDAVQYNMTGFLQEIGMLKEVDKFFSDYTSRQKTITKAMIDEVIDYASQYPDPPFSTIQYISGNSLAAFKYQRRIEGTFGTGLTDIHLGKRVSHASWQHVVVFKTYSGTELTHITLVGTGNAGNLSTDVPYVAGTSTRIEAVAFDGSETLVFGSRD